MKVYSFTQARQKLAEVLAEARDADVVIKRRNGEAFIVRRQPAMRSPLDGPGIATRVTTKNNVDAVRKSRAR